MDKPVFDKGLVLPDKLICLSKRHVKCPGVTPGYANAQPPGLDKIANAPLLGQHELMPSSCQGGGGGGE